MPLAEIVIAFQSLFLCCETDSQLLCWPCEVSTDSFLIFSVARWEAVSMALILLHLGMVKELQRVMDLEIAKWLVNFNLY